MKPFLTHITPEQLARLQSISLATNQPIAAIIRHCIDKQLPQLEERFGTSTKVPLTVNS